MRDVLVIGIILASLPFCFTRPFFGGLMWTWIAFMNPHRLAWGFARYFLSPALLVGGATLLGFLLSREPKRLPRNLGTYLLISVWVTLTISTFVAHNPEEAWLAYDQRTKIIVMLLIIVAVTHTHAQLRWLFLVTALSIGFYGLKGGVFAILTGGQHHVFGPYQSFIGDNNALALAINMVLPLLFYLARETTDRRLRLGLRVVLGFSIFAVVSTYSRGGLLGLSTVALMLLMKNGRKWLGIIVLVLGVTTVLAFAPEQWTTRMRTIESYETEGSAMSRIHAWTLAWRLAVARPVFGWGPQAMEDKSLYDRYYADSPSRNDAHSAYFQLLAEGGFAGFLVWLFLLLWSLFALQRIAWRFRRDSERGWMANYADMLQVGIAAFMVGGAFLEFAFFDLLYHFVGGAILLTDFARQASTVAVPERTPVRRASVVPPAAAVPSPAPVSARA